MKHGTTAYRDGCRCSICRRAMADAALVRRNRLYLGRTESLATSPLGTHRRIQSLVALGWSMSEISRQCGYDRSHIALMLKRVSPIHLPTAERIAKVYADLSMRLPPQTTKLQKIDASRSRNMARRNGWPPPLAWDDIDDPAEQPRDWHYTAASRAEQFAELYDRGDGLADVCRSLHLSEKSLERWCQRNDRAGDFTTLRDRDRGHVVQRNQYSEEAS